MTKVCTAALICLPLLLQAQTAQVYIAGTNYPAFFADTNLSATVQQRMASDLTVVFSAVPSFQAARSSPVASTVPLPGGGTSIIKTSLQSSWEGAYIPYRFRCMFIKEENLNGVFLVDYNGQKSVRVTQAVSDRYLQAFAQMETHSNAVQKLQEFIALVKSPGLSSLPLQILEGMHNTPPSYREEYGEDEYRSFARELEQKVQIFDCSALNFLVEPQLYPEFGTDEIPITFLFTKLKSSPSGYVLGLPLLFHNGKWGFGKYW